LDGNLVWNPEMFVLHFIGHLLKPNSARQKQENLEKCAMELIDITKNFSKTTTSYLQQVRYIIKKKLFIITHGFDDNLIVSFDFPLKINTS